MNWRRTIPWLLMAFRFLLGPAIVLVAARAAAPQPWLGGMIAAGFLSDVYDGILARRWGTATARLRIADSSIDVVFYLFLLAAAVLRHWPVLRDRWALIAAVLLLEAANMVVSFAKFGRAASYHSYAAKAWGVMLALSLIALLCFDGAFWLVTVTLAWGILCEFEGLGMSILLPEWTHDVKSLRRAIAIRRSFRSRELVHAGS